MNSSTNAVTSKLDDLNPAQLQTVIHEAQVRLAETRDEQIVKFRAKVISEMKAQGFTFDEIFAGNQARRLMKAKFANPANPNQTWSGHGKRPKWYVEAIKRGKTEESLLLENVIRGHDRTLN